MAIIVFVVGRSGSGKSTAVNQMMKLAACYDYSTTHIRDYPILRDMSREPKYQAKFRPIKRNGFDVLNFSVLDVALERLLAKVSALENSHKYDIIFVEFARRRYEASFKRLSASLQKKYYILLVEASLETCIERIDKRTTGSCDDDQHYISNEIMKGYFSVDNLPYVNDEFAKQLGLPQNHLTAICNEGLEEKFKRDINNYANFIFQDASHQRKIAALAKARKKVPRLPVHLHLSPTLKEIRVFAKTTSQDKRASISATVPIPAIVQSNEQVHSSDVVAAGKELAPIE